MLPKYLQSDLQDHPEDHAHDQTQYKIYSASSLRLSQTNTSSCSGFVFKSAKVGIIVVADLPYRDQFAVQIKSHRCYAAWRGYEYILLDGEAYPSCKRFHQFFFRK